jgi:hypothetical protein
MSNELTAMYRGLLQETVALMEGFGVREGVGKDGELLKRINEALGTGAVKIMINTSRPSGCPLCGAPNALECDCDPAAQMEAMGQ